MNSLLLIKKKKKNAIHPFQFPISFSVSTLMFQTILIIWPLSKEINHVI